MEKIMNIQAESLIPILIKNQYNANDQDIRFSYNDEAPSDDIITQFHMKSSMTIKTDDDYFCGMRANHFLIEYGWTEAEDSGDGGWLLVTCNHKGYRQSVCFKNTDPIVSKYFEKLDEQTVILGEMCFEE